MKIEIINESQHPLPSYQTIGSAGMDLYANINEPITFAVMERCLISTGIRIALPLGVEAQVRPRSGLALKKGLTCLNAPGTIDSDYRGVIGVILINLSSTEQVVQPGERIAQLVIARYEHIEWNAVESLNETTRESGGFGSTGV
jgi:dUTP pyrophosphatase